jgi:hypothetical protein
MAPMDALWHLLNFLEPAVGVPLIAALLVKLLWWRELKSVAFKGLFAWAMGAGVVVWVAGLLILGQDGRMATYAALVLAVAITLWWRAGMARLKA